MSTPVQNRVYGCTTLALNMVYTVFTQQGKKFSNTAVRIGLKIPGSTPTAKLKVKHPKKTFAFLRKDTVPSPRNKNNKI